VVLLQELQVGNLVAPEVADNILAPQKLGDLAGFLLKLLQLAEDLLFPLGVLNGRLLQSFELAVQVGDVIGHVGLFEEGKLGLGVLARLLLVDDVARLLVNQLAGPELQQREDHVAVEMRGELGEQVEVGRRGRPVGGCGSHAGRFADDARSGGASIWRR